MSYLPLQELFDIQTATKNAVTEHRQVVPMWDATNNVAFYRVTYWSPVSNNMESKDVNSNMSAIYVAGANAIPLEMHLPVGAATEDGQNISNTELSEIRQNAINGLQKTQIFPAANVFISNTNISALNGLAIAVQDIENTKHKKIQFALTGTFSLTLTAQATNNGSNYFAIPIKNATTGQLANTVNAAGLYSVDVSMLKNFRLICTAYVSGTVNTIAYGVFESTDVAIPVVATQAVSGSVSVTGNPAVVLTPLASAGASPLGAFVSAASGAQTTAVIKASAGVLYGLAYAVVQGGRGSQGAVYLRLYNTTTAPTVGTTVPIHVLRLTSDGNGYISFGDMGIRFSTGISIAITGAIANTATNTSVASSVSFLGI